MRAVTDRSRRNPPADLERGSGAVFHIGGLLAMQSLYSLWCRLAAMRFETDYLVLGSGAAGLVFALCAAEHGRVTVVTKRSRDDSASAWAQGGIAAVVSETDSWQMHAEDTRRAGAGLCHEVVVDLCVREGKDAIHWLMDVGAQFSKRDGALQLGREGGHSERRGDRK